jgi:hypothetical protein
MAEKKKARSLAAPSLLNGFELMSYSAAASSALASPPSAASEA